MEQTGEAIAEELLRHINACNEKANKRQGLPLNTRNVSHAWSKQEKTYYHALKEAQRLWEGRHPGWEEDQLLAGKYEAIMAALGYGEGTVLGGATEEWDSRTAFKRMSECRWDKVESRTDIGPGGLSFKESARLACRVTKPARAS